MVNPRIDGFLANLDKHGGPSKSERFYVQITPPQSLPNPTFDLQFQCDMAEIPGISVETIKYRFYGPERNLALGAVFEETIIEIICTNDFYEKPFFDSWINLINPNTGWDLNYKDMYTGAVTIFQLDQQANVIYSANLINAWPSHVGALQTRWADDSIHKLSVTFLYDRYEPSTGTTFSTGQTLSALQNPFTA